MTQSLVVIGLFLCVLVSLPFVIDYLKKRYGWAPAASAGSARMVSALSVGPQQKVVTVEVGPPQARVWLVLGVTPQAIQCLHTLPAEVATPAAAQTPGGPQTGLAVPSERP
jgi:flagellar protein FliO/FliZ